MAVTKVTIVDSPKKMRKQSNGYSIIIPQKEERVLNYGQTKAKKNPKPSSKKENNSCFL